MTSPFRYLHNLVLDVQSIGKPTFGSDQTRLGPPNKAHTESHTKAEEQFPALLRFEEEQRAKLTELLRSPESS